MAGNDHEINMAFADNAYVIKVHDDRSEVQDTSTRANDARNNQVLSSRTGGILQTTAFGVGERVLAAFNLFHNSGLEMNDNNRLVATTIEDVQDTSVHVMNTDHFGIDAAINR